MKSNRPMVINFACAILVIELARQLLIYRNTFYLNEKFSEPVLGLIATSIIVLVQFICAYGIWLMKKWPFIIYTVFYFISTIAIIFITHTIFHIALVIPLIVIILSFTKFKQMS